MLKRFLPLFLIVLALGCEAQIPEAGRSPAVPFSKDLPWLNVSRPLTLDDLKGKVVILDFWTYGCINCQHVIPDLKRLKQDFGDKLAVIGVHSPKFENEKNSKTLRNVVVRYGIEYPVVSDVDFSQWKAYGVRAWPTQVVLDTKGRAAAGFSGEGHYDDLSNVVSALLAETEDVNAKPLPIALEKDKITHSFLAAPGKVSVSEDYIAISDTLHNRIVLSAHDGTVKMVIGSGKRGTADGDFASAEFNMPQGTAFTASQNGAGLYVADTYNDLIRYVDLEKKTVKTIAGNGKGDYYIGGSKPALEASLRSPWDLALDGDKLYIAMAGIHQIWRMDLADNTVGPYAGTGREDIRDGGLDDSAFSQPSGLSLRKPWLYVADAEDSAVRRIQLDEGRVETLVGKGLFEFGDRAGDFGQAKLQHLLGIAVLDDNHVVIADTYNHRLKELDLQAETVQSLAGTGQPDGGAAGLDEPGGVAILDGKALIADTNNDRIAVFDPETKMLSTLPVVPMACCAPQPSTH